MSIREDEDRLFAEWSAARSSLFSDGVVDEDRFRSARIKLAFVPKEPNSQEPFGDLREYFREPIFASTSNNLARWAYGIQNMDRDVPWQEVKTVTFERRKKWLEPTCIINVKKSAGGGASSSTVVLHAMQEDHRYISRQISIYRPFLDLVICCGWPTDQIRVVEPPPWRHTDRGLRFYEFERRKYVLAYYHPQAHYPSKLLFYALADSVREILGLPSARE
jgi:hypothetical protein